MDGAVIVLGAVVLGATLLWLVAVCVGKFLQRIERSYPDPTLPSLRSKPVRLGCGFDHRKYLQFRLKMARRQLADAHHRCRDLRAALRADAPSIREFTPIRRHA
jgi:hypothetical protein